MSLGVILIVEEHFCLVDPESFLEVVRIHSGIFDFGRKKEAAPVVRTRCGHAMLCDLILKDDDVSESFSPEQPSPYSSTRSRLPLRQP